MAGCLRISVWSGPRNVSTALMYAFAQRPDTYAVDEPFYGYYLRVTGAKHPGRQTIMESMEGEAAKIIGRLILGPCDRPVLFLKNMAHHLVDLELGFLKHMTNILLIRDPKEMLPSLAQNLPAPTLQDAAYKTQVEIFSRLREMGQEPPVLDARHLLLNPQSVLQQLCRRIGLAFDEVMLSWPPGPKVEDGVWAKDWYQNVHQSTGFLPYKPKEEPFPGQLRPLLEECQPYYEQLIKFAIKAGD